MFEYTISTRCFSFVTEFYFCYYSLLLALKFKDLANILSTDDQIGKYQGANSFLK